MNSVVDVMDKGNPPCVENYQDPVEPMYMFVNGMQQPADTDQFMFIVTDDGKHDSYVYNRLVHLNIEKKWYFMVSQQDFVGINGSVDSEIPSSSCLCKETQNAAIKSFFETNMVDANRFPRPEWGKNEMKNMMFLVNIVWLDLIKVHLVSRKCDYVMCSTLACLSMWFCI